MTASPLSTPTIDLRIQLLQNSLPEIKNLRKGRTSVALRISLGSSCTPMRDLEELALLRMVEGEVEVHIHCRSNTSNGHSLLIKAQSGLRGIPKTLADQP